MSHGVKTSQVQLLHDAIESQDLEAVQKHLAAAGQDVSHLCETNLPGHGAAIYWAAKVGTPSVVEELVKSGASINTPAEGNHVISGQTALHEACQKGNVSMVAKILSLGGDAHARDSDGQTPLHWACQQSSDFDVLIMLLSKGADVNARDARRETALQKSILRCPTEISKFLLSKGADANVLDSDGQCPLHYASEWDDLELVQDLLNRGCSANLQDNEGRSPLHLAANDEILELLIKHGGDCTIRDNRGKPPREKRLNLDTKEIKELDAALGRRTQQVAAETLTVVSSTDSGNIAKQTQNVQEVNIHDTVAGTSRYTPSPLASAGVLAQLRSTRDEQK